MSDSKTVPIIMPAPNVEAFGAEAPNSAESRTWANIELVVVDAGSADGAPSILSDRAAASERPPGCTHLVRQANTGAAAAPNKGLNAATAAFIAFLYAGAVSTRTVRRSR